MKETVLWKDNMRVEVSFSFLNESEMTQNRT